MKMFGLGAIVALVAVILSSWALGDEDLLCVVLRNPELCGKVAWLQAIAWAAAIIVAIAGVLEIRNRSRQARASFLLEHHVQWLSLTESRNAFNTLKKEVSGDVEKEYPALKEAALEDKKRDAFEPKLNEIFEDDQPRYRLLLQTIGFFENLGYMVKRNYIPEADAIALYRGPIADMGVVVARHIAWRQNAANIPPGLYENLLYLVRRVESRTKRNSD